MGEGGCAAAHRRLSAAKEVNKVLKVLRSEATPLVKKRFIMHKRFGNYRELMKTHRCRPGTRAPATIAMASKDR